MAGQRPNVATKLLPLLDIDVVRNFVMIAETGSFTQAAALVFRTPSALSMQIKRVEEILGCPLFVREARQIRLTPEGEVLLSYGRRMLQLNEEAVKQFLDPDLEGRVGLGATDDVGSRVLPGVLAQFARSYPSVQVDVVIGSSRQMLEQLDAGELDLALITVGNPGQEQRGEILHTETLVWACREGGVAHRRSPLPLALAGQGCVWRASALSVLDTAGIPYRIAYTCENCAGQEAAMLADLAIAPFPASLIASPIRKIEKDRLPALGQYQVALVCKALMEGPAQALAGSVRDAFSDTSTFSQAS